MKPDILMGDKAVEVLRKYANSDTLQTLRGKFGMGFAYFKSPKRFCLGIILSEGETFQAIVLGFPQETTDEKEALKFFRRVEKSVTGDFIKDTINAEIDKAADETPPKAFRFDTNLDAARQ